MAELSPQHEPKRSWQHGWFVGPLVFIATFAGVALGLSLWPERSLSGAAAAEMNISKDEFERRVHDYLLEHPEVIGEAINRLEARQREETAKQAQAALKVHAEQVFHDPNDPISGNPGGDATLVEFFDYNCPYCKSMAPVMTQAETADPRLRVVYKEFPILGPDSVFAAKAALAANKQGKYVAFHRALFQARGHVDQSKVLELAKTVGLDVARLRADMQMPEISDHIDKTIKLAQALGITGTPGFAIGDNVFTGATDLKSLQAAIVSARKLPNAGR